MRARVIIRVDRALASVVVLVDQGIDVNYPVRRVALVVSRGVHCPAAVGLFYAGEPIVRKNIAVIAKGATRVVLGEALLATVIAGDGRDRCEPDQPQYY